MGRFIILKADIADTTYVLINIYAPNKDKEIANFFKDLTTVLKKENLDTEENIIVGGDFNCPIVLLKSGERFLPHMGYLNR